MKIKYDKIEVKQIGEKNGKPYPGYKAECRVVINGKPIRKRIERKTKKEAKQAMLDWLEIEEKKLEKIAEIDEDTLAYALEGFIEDMLTVKWEESTARRNRTVLNGQIKGYAIAMKHPLLITREDIISHLKILKDEGYADSTLDKCLSLVRNYFNSKYYNKRNNPCTKIHIGYEPEVSEEEVLDMNEMKRYFKTCDEIGGNADLLKFLCLTYLRSGEASVLKYSDWSKGNKQIKIQRTKTQDSNGHVIVGRDGHAKTKSSLRELILSDMANDILKERYTTVFLKEGKVKRDRFIWTQKKDKSKPIDYNTLRRLHERVLSEAGIGKKVTLHGLRHSGITLYAADKDNFLTVSRNAGHSRSATTEKIYQHTLKQHKEKAAESANRINEIFVIDDEV